MNTLDALNQLVEGVHFHRRVFPYTLPIFYGEQVPNGSKNRPMNQTNPHYIFTR